MRKIIVIFIILTVMVISISIAFVLYYNQKKAIYYAEHSLLYKYCIDNYNANNRNFLYNKFLSTVAQKDDTLYNRSKSGDFFEALLKKINTYQYADNRKFQKKKKRRGKRIYIPLKQELRSFSQWEWEEQCRKGRFTPREQALFGKMEYYCHRSKRFETYYEFIDKWRFELRVKPNMITHYRPVDVAIEREFAELDKIINDYNNWNIIANRIYGHSYRYSWLYYEKRYNSKEKYKRTPLKEITALKYHTSAMEIADKI